MLFKRIVYAAAPLVGVLAVAAAGSVAAQGWTPTETVEIVAPSSPGGGNDRTARTIQEILKDVGLTDTVVSNMPGAGGARAYAHTMENKGNPHIITVTRTGLSSNHIIGRSPFNHRDLTVIAMVVDDTMCIAVNAESSIMNLKDMMEALKKDPRSISISVGSSRAAVAEILVSRVAQAADVDPKQLKIVTFSGSAEGTAALLGGHVDMVSTPIRAVTEFEKGGKIRVIALAAQQRASALPHIPTLIDQGLDVTQGGWTAITAPPGLTKEQLTYWEDIFDKVTQHPKWKELEKGRFVDRFFLRSEEANAFLDADYDAVKSTLVALGVAK